MSKPLYKAAGNKAL